MRAFHRSFLLRISLTFPARFTSALVASLLLTGGLVSVLAAPAVKVAFPAAAGIKPGVVPVGPTQVKPVPNALNQYASPEDAVIFDFDNTTIYTINSQGASAGAATVVASPSVGSGTAFTQKVSFGTVSPTQQLYYWNSNTALFYRVDLTSATYPRA